MSDSTKQQAYDEVVTTLRRAHPRPVKKDRLPEDSGASVDDLRAALDRLGEEAAIEQTDDGYVWVEPEERRLAVGQDPDAREEDRGEPEPGAEEEDAQVGAARLSLPGVDAPTGDTRYAVTIVQEITFYPELQEGESEDDAAVREAQALAALTVDGVLEEHPDLPIMMRIASVEAFDRRRAVPLP